MKRSATLIPAILAASVATAAANVTNTVMMVDQRGNLNVEGVASVADVATNAVKATIAEQKAAAAQETAQGVANALQGVAANIMTNNVVIYRSGFSDSFAALVVFTENDRLDIVDARWVEKSAARIVVEVDYVATFNMGLTKPLVYHHNTVTNRGDFAKLDDANVTTPVFHAGEREFGGQTFSGYYTITATIPNPSGTSSYFLWIKAQADAPGGDGLTLDLPNGVTGGVTGDMTWGDKILTFRGGVLKEVSEL